jgi:hypothetical protein
MSRVVALAVVVLALLAVLFATGLVPVPWPTGSGDAPAGEAGREAGGGDGPEAPGLVGAAMGEAPPEAGRADVPAAPVEDVVPAEARGSAAPLGGGVVRGRVVRGETKAPVEGVTVRLLRPDSLFAYLRARREGRHDELVARTDASGKFAFRDVLPATGYAVWAKPAGAASATRGGVDVLAKRATDLGDLAIGPSGGLGGKVVDGTGKPIAGVRVAVTWQVVNEFHVILADPATLPWTEAEATTDAEGAWAARTLEPGDKTVVLRAPSGASAVLAKVACREGEVRKDVDVVLGGTLAISGAVVWEDGAPVAEARIYAKSIRDAAAHTMDTGADGLFRLGPLAEGTYQMAVLVAGLPVRMAKTAKAGAEGVRVVVPRGGALVGTVASASTGKPLARFRITPVYTGEQDAIARYLSERIQKVLGPVGFSSADGSFRFDRLHPGAYTLVVEADGYPRFDAEGARVVAGKESEAPPIAVPDGHRAAGVVMDASGKPVADVRVFLSPDERAGEVQPEEMETVVSDTDPDAVTDESGAFETALLTPAVYRLGAVAEGRMPGTLEGLDLRAGSRADLRVTLPPGGGISVRLVDASGRPVPGQNVAFCYEDGFLDDRETDDGGVAAMRPARTGRWVVVWSSRTVRGVLQPRSAPGGPPVAPPTAAQRYEALRVLPGAEEVVVSDGAQREVTIRLPRLVRVRGRARFDGRPPTGARIGLWSGATWTEGRLDPDGRFEFDNVEPGPCSVYLSVPGDDAAPWQRRPLQVPDAVEHSVDLEFGR